jgi:hypothetical protein
MAKKSSSLTRAAAQVRITLDRRPRAHFLHIGKTAGTAVKVALKHAPGQARYRVVLHTHGDHLDAIPETDHFFFCVRDPISRFVSGFLSRQRQGLPRFHIPWTEDEAEAFARFDSPVALAVSLSAGGREQQHAETAMRTIYHVRDSYWKWFEEPDYLKRRSDNILWIGRQESLDLRPLATRLELESLELPADPRRANKTIHAKPELSELARQNLREWYAKDYEFLELCDVLHPAAADLVELNGRGSNQAFVGRMMSGRPFALGNADAIRLAKIARPKHRSQRWLVSHAASLRHR